MLNRYCRFICGVISRFLFHLQVKGRKNVYKVKGAIFAVNHTSFIDPVFAAIASPRKLHFLVRRSLYQYKFFGKLIANVNTIPVDRDRLDSGAFKKIIKVLKSGKLLLIFPEGTRSPDGNLLPGRSGIGLIALKAKVPIIPVYVKGTYKIFPRHRNFIRLGKASVSVGEPIYLDTWLKKPHTEKTDYQEIADLVMKRIRQLKESM